MIAGPRVCRLFALLAVVVAVLTPLIGCGGDQEQGPAGPTEQEEGPDSGEGGESESPEHDTGGEEDSGGNSGGETGRLTNVVGKDHQLARDTMQAAGSYNLSKEAASGQDRLLLDDRNGTVVSQSPKGGSRASADRTIILRSKKRGR